MEGAPPGLAGLLKHRVCSFFANSGFTVWMASLSVRSPVDGYSHRFFSQSFCDCVCCRIYLLSFQTHRLRGAETPRGHWEMQVA